MEVEAIEHYAQKMTDLVGRIDALIEIQQARNTIQVTHTQTGMSAWAAAAVVACFCTWFGLIMVMFDLHDMRAWVDILRQRVTILEKR